VDQPHALTALLLLGCSGEEEGAIELPFAQLATIVVSAPSATGTGFSDPELAVNGVRGGGQAQGSMDVYSLTEDPADELVLGFEEPVLDGEGTDLVVFENPFDISSGGRFMDPVVVEVSADGETFVAFPYEYGQAEYSEEPSDWLGFAGITPVLLHEEDAPTDPLSAEAGGDGFDLAGLQPPVPEVWFVRLTAASSWTDPVTSAAFPTDPASDGPDIDGVYARLP
jgi:hypothetical protein